MNGKMTRRKFGQVTAATLGASILDAQTASPQRSGGAGERTEVEALRPPGPLNDITFRNLDARFRDAIESIRHQATAAEADAARPEFRRKLEYSLGYLRLPWPPQLDRRVTGIVKRPGYRVEKIVYQSLPGTLVPAHLYAPEHQSGRAPGLVFFNGHWPRESKMLPTHQALCINLARQGFLVLNFDPPGQGERGLSTRDHRRSELLLVGVSEEGLMEHETRCAITYLESRDDVDPNRLGMIGASGGGLNTWITTALDSRIRVAAPVVGTCDFYEQSIGALPRDWGPKDHCHKIARINTWANNHELLAMGAPKPVLIVSSVLDLSFPIAGARRVFAYGKRLYETYGKPDHIAMFEDTHTGHDLEKAKREPIYGWFQHWFMGRADASAIPEPPTETEPVDSPEMRCFGAGSNQPAGPGILRAVKSLAEKTPKALSTDYASVLGALPAEPVQRPVLQPVRRQRLLIPSEENLLLPAYLLTPQDAVRGVVVAMDDHGKENLAETAFCRQALASGWAFCGLDARANGELSSAHPNWIFAVHLLLGDNLPWRQGWDLSQAGRYLSGLRDFAPLPVVLYGNGPGASLAVSYALAMPAVKRLRKVGFVQQGGFLSFRDFLERPQNEKLSFKLQQCEPKDEQPLDREIPPDYFVFDALRYFDLPDLFATAGALGLVVDPIDGDWNVIPTSAAAGKVPSNVRAIDSHELSAGISKYVLQFR